MNILLNPKYFCIVRFVASEFIFSALHDCSMESLFLAAQFVKRLHLLCFSLFSFIHFQIYDNEIIMFTDTHCETNTQVYVVFLTSVMCDVIEGGYPNIADLQFWPFSQKLHPLVPQTFCLWETANKNKVALKGEE